MKRNTYTTCVRGTLSSMLAICVECFKKDEPGNRFPNHEEKKDEQETD